MSLDRPLYCVRCKQPKRALVLMDDLRICSECFELHQSEFATFATTLRSRRRRERVTEEDRSESAFDAAMRGEL